MEPFSKEIKNKLDVFEGRWLRRIIGVKWPKVISNEELRQRTGQVKLSEGGISRAIRWAGHVWRMDESRIARSVEKFKNLNLKYQIIKITLRRERMLTFQTMIPCHFYTYFIKLVQR
jgi:hypothetical protein